MEECKCKRDVDFQQWWDDVKKAVDYHVIKQGAGCAWPDVVIDAVDTVCAKRFGYASLAEFRVEKAKNLGYEEGK